LQVRLTVDPVYAVFLLSPSSFTYSIYGPCCFPEDENQSFFSELGFKLDLPQVDFYLMLCLFISLE